MPQYDPACMLCTRYEPDDTCEAFPKGIPRKILEGEVKHIKAYPGDHGLQFDPIDEDAKKLIEGI
jgi:hypothetical protein